MKKKQELYWAGFVNGNSVWEVLPDKIDGNKNPDCLSIYKTKGEAIKVGYTDIRKVKIVEVK